MLSYSASAGDFGTDKGGNFKKETFAKDNFNKDGEGLTPPTVGQGGTTQAPIGSGMYILFIGGILFFGIRVRSELKKGRHVEKSC